MQGRLFTSTALPAELTNILGRRKFDKKIAASTLTVDQIVDRYAALAALVRPTPTPRIAPDPDDDVVKFATRPWPGSAHARLEIRPPRRPRADAQVGTDALDVDELETQAIGQAFERPEGRHLAAQAQHRGCQVDQQLIDQPGGEQ